MTKAKGYTIRPDGKKDTGRPTSMTQETIDKLEQAFSLGCSDKEACLFANISTQTLYDYQHNHPEFIDRKELLKEKQVLKARSIITKAINDGDKDMAKWYLERKKKKEFSTRIESTGADGEPLNPPVISITVIDSTENE